MQPTAMSGRIRPRHAASLILLKPDGGDGLVLMGKRPSASAFIPDAFVFPGGKLDPADRGIHSPYPLSQQTLGAMRGAASGEDGLSEALAYAAIRETYEETGLLVGCSGSFSGAEEGTWQALHELGLTPHASGLKLLARAITPSLSPVRYHARFFVAEANQTVGEAKSSDELLEVAWYPIPEALGLPMIDVTETILESAQAYLRSGSLARGEAPSTTTFVRYRGERRMVSQEDPNRA